MPAFMLNLVSRKHGHKFVELCELALELWEMQTSVSGTREFVFIVIVSKLVVVWFIGF